MAERERERERERETEAEFIYSIVQSGAAISG